MLRNYSKTMILLSLYLVFASCSGLKVINPNDKNENEGAKALDWNGGSPKLVDTYTCKIVASNGKKVSAMGKSELEARKETLAQCRNQTIVSFCLEKNLSCVKN